jgi:hypothetical protein
MSGIGRALVFAVGWLPSILVVTGTMMWLRGGRAGQRRKLNH